MIDWDSAHIVVFSGVRYDPDYHDQVFAPRDNMPKPCVINLMVVDEDSGDSDDLVDFTPQDIVALWVHILNGVRFLIFFRDHDSMHKFVQCYQELYPGMLLVEGK